MHMCSLWSHAHLMYAVVTFACDVCCGHMHMWYILLSHAHLMYAVVTCTCDVSCGHMHMWCMLWSHAHVMYPVVTCTCDVSCCHMHKSVPPEIFRPGWLVDLNGPDRSVYNAKPSSRRGYRHKMRISGCRRTYIRSSLFWNVRQPWLVVTNILSVSLGRQVVPKRR
jgi:hypothetical protein